jgi:TRAP-type C4-dicarboxylate transport system substrate-binding protein
MNRESYDSLDAQTRAILDGLGKEYLVEYVAVLDKQTQDILAEWKTKTGVKIIPFPQEPIAKATQSAGVQEVRQEWIKKAHAVDLPTDDIVEFFAFK